MTKQKLFYPACCAAAFVALLVAYSNHFQNSFHFDDSHTIENNLYLRDVKNIPLFFRDSRTFSSLPYNQSYRPLVTTTLALDYRLAGGLAPWAFHADSFLLFVAQCALLLLLYRLLFDAARPSAWNRWIALFAATLYGLHAANAETVNYIISRSDILSTLGVVAGLWLYAARPRARRSFLYLLPVVLGLFAKEQAAMFAPLLLLFVAFFEDGLSVFETLRPRRLFSLVVRTLPAFVVCGALVIFSLKMAPAWVSGGTSRLQYLMTQPFVMLHYFFTFFLPLNLTADTDWKLITNPFDDRLLAGLVFIAAMLAVAVRTSRRRVTRPIAFGILWFFVALLPTSSLVPFSEVMNDHRLYFPFVGLTLAACWSAALLLERAVPLLSRSPAARFALIGAGTLLLAGHAYGTHARNEVWRNEESLWLDVTQKSPENPRGLMNYGLARMGKGDYTVAQDYFERSLAVAPQYGYAHINLAIALSATGRGLDAERHFREGLRYQPGLPSFHYFFARWLASAGREDEAMEHLRTAIQLSPADQVSRDLLMDLLARRRAYKELSQVARQMLDIEPRAAKAQKYLKEAQDALEFSGEGTPTTAEGFLAQSLNYYRQGKYLDVIASCERALALRPGYAEAFNNECTALNALGRYGEAKSACEEALRLQPSFELARNNLAVALRALAGR